MEGIVCCRLLRWSECVRRVLVRVAFVGTRTSIAGQLIQLLSLRLALLEVLILGLTVVTSAALLKPAPEAMMAAVSFLCGCQRATLSLRWFVASCPVPCWARSRDENHLRFQEGNMRQRYKTVMRRTSREVSVHCGPLDLSEPGSNPSRWSQARRNMLATPDCSKLVRLRGGRGGLKRGCVEAARELELRSRMPSS